MWSVQAIVEPPTNVLSLQHGQVVITGSDAKHAPAEPDTKVVGQATTVALCRPADGAVDPWLAQDPWSKAVTQTAPQPAQQPAPNVLHELEQRLEKTLLDRLPVSDRMEVDGQDQRLQVLEQQVQQLASRQTSFEHTVQDNHQQNTAQVQSLQQQMKVQLDMQSQQMQSMLTDQMTRLEAILAKTENRMKVWGPCQTAHEQGVPWTFPSAPGAFCHVYVSLSLPCWRSTSSRPHCRTMVTWDL